MNSEHTCEFCSYGGAPAIQYGGNDLGKTMFLCGVCASSYARNIGRYPQQYDHTTTVLAQIVSQQTNYILEKMGFLNTDQV